MAVTMSEASIDQSKRQGLLDQNLSRSTLGSGEELNTSFSWGTSEIPMFHFEADGNHIAGITADFLPKFQAAVDEYEAEVKNSIEKLNTTKEEYLQNAFKGSAIEEAITSFVTSVKQVANNYLTSLKNAEMQIAQSVQNVYQQQDTDISSNLNKDASTLVDAGPNS